MMVRWAETAADDLEQIGLYLKENNPSFAHSTVLRIYEAVQSLRQFPNRGRFGHIEDTRELIVPRLPYIIVYQVSPKVVHVLRIVHGAERQQ